MLKAIFFRYLGTFLQFLLLATIASLTSAHDYGLYMLCLGFVFSLYYVVGLGTSEAAVVEITRARALGGGSAVEQSVGGVFVTSLLSSGLLAALAALVLLVDPFHGDTSTATALVLFLVASNGVVFNVSQLLLALGRGAIGSFFFYPAINLALFCSIGPLALFTTHIGFATLALVSALGSALTAAIAVAICARMCGDVMVSTTSPFTLSLMTRGIPLLASRLLHVVSFWVPTMVVGFINSPSDAGVVGTAGRMTIAVSAIIAAIRFIIRPAISAALAQSDLGGLRVLAGSTAFITCTLSVIAMAVNWAIGVQFIATFFGPNFAGVFPLFTIMLLSVTAEAAFGPVDEILKMAGHQAIVLRIYGTALPIFVIGCLVVSQVGLIYLAWLQVIYVAGVFLALNLAVRRTFGFVVLPCWPDMHAIRRIG